MKNIQDIVIELEEKYLPHGNDMMWEEVQAWCILYWAIRHRDSGDEGQAMVEKELRQHYKAIQEQFELVEEERTITQTVTIMKDRWYD